MSRKLAREAALRSLYQVELGRDKPEIATDYNARELGLDQAKKTFVEKLVFGVLENLEDIDRLISQHSVGWKLKRMPVIDRNILRLAAYEILHEKETPTSVAVNEAIEIAKKYGNVESSRFINGILGSILKVSK